MQTVLKYPGSKWSMHEWIISNFPIGYEKMTYLEPFFGSGAVFFNKKRSVIETINDLDSRVVNLFRVIREDSEELASMLENTPWSREEYNLSYEVSEDALEDARRFLVRMWMGIGSKTSDITGWRNNIQDLNGNVNQWATRLPDRIKEASARLKHNDNCLVQIENQPALKLILRHNKSNVLIYADPPYVLKTRRSRIYKHEFTDNDHLDLLEVLKNHKGPVIISGYEYEMYDTSLNNWNKISIQANAEGGAKRQEVLWMNYEPPIEQLRLII